MITLDGVELPEDLLWQDEFAYDAVAQSLTRFEGGGLLVEETALQAGRPITLAGDVQSGWILRTALLAVGSLAAAANTTYELVLNDGRTFNVIFARPKPISAEPIIPYSTPASGDFYAVTIRLLTV